MKKPRLPIRLHLGFYLPGTRTEYLLLFLTAFSAVFFGFVIIFAGLIGSAKLLGQIKKEKKSLKTLNQKIEDLAAAETAYNKLRGDISLLEEALPDNYLPASFLREMALTLGRHRLTLRTIRLGKTQTRRLPKITVLPFTLRLTGDYADFMRALVELERSGRRVDTESLRINQLPGQTGVEVNLKLLTYFYSRSGTK